jgi:Zn-dependent peptidase ImmA (M78 family)
VGGHQQKKFEDSELEALLDEDDTQTQQQQQLADQLNVSREDISRRLKAMGKIHKIGKWVPHELNERQQENRKKKLFAKCFSLGTKESHFYIEL